MPMGRHRTQDPWRLIRESQIDKGEMVAALDPSRICHDPSYPTQLAIEPAEVRRTILPIVTFW